MSFTLNALTVENGVTEDEGGGIDNWSGTMTITNSTIANNTTGNRDGGGIFARLGTVNVGGSIVANNRSGAFGSNCGRDQGTIVSQGYNLVNNNECFNQATDQLSTNPRLNALANNGGPTPTMSLQSNSPAINTIPVSGGIGCSLNGLQSGGTDQPRPDTQVNSLGVVGPEEFCDKGAYELQDNTL